MPLVNQFSILNRKGESIGLIFGPGMKTRAELTALLLQRDEEGFVVLVNRLMSFVRLDRDWFPMVSADRSYLERPKDFMGVLQNGKLRKSEGWKESRLRTFWWLWKWRRNRKIGFFEQPTMAKCFERKYKKHDPLGLG